MFHQVFNPDNFIFRAIGRLVDLVALSLLWLACSLPLVTAGPASAALYYAVVKGVRRGEGRACRWFFHSLRENLRVGIPASVAAGAAGLLLYNGLLLSERLAVSGGRQELFFYMAYRVLLLLPAGVACYLFPVLSRFTFGVGRLFSVSFQLAVRHLPSTVVLVLLNLQGAALCWRSVQTALASFGQSAQAIPYLQYWLPFLLVPSVLALLSSLFLERIFKKYTPAQPSAPGTDDSPAPWYLR